MQSTLEMYVERATDCRREADGTNLTNVRDRCLRAALAWDEMAHRLRLNDTYRRDEIIRKSEREMTSA